MKYVEKYWFFGEKNAIVERPKFGNNSLTPQGTPSKTNSSYKNKEVNPHQKTTKILLDIRD